MRIGYSINEEMLMIDFNKLTNQAQEILYSAQQRMSKFQNRQLEHAHIMLAVVEAKEGIASDYTNALKLNNQSFRDALMSELNNYPRVEQPVNTQQLYLSSDSIKLFDKAQEEAEMLKDTYISIEHILLAIVDFNGLKLKEPHGFGKKGQA